MTIATINNISLPFILFLSIFSFICLLLHREQPAAPTEIKPAFTAELNPEPQGEPKEIPSPPIVPQPQPTIPLALPPGKSRRHNGTVPLTNPVLVTPPPTIAASLDGLDLDRLPLRQARKVARALGIKQKVSGKDKPVKFLRAEIKQRLKAEPTTTAETLQAVLAA